MAIQSAKKGAKRPYRKKRPAKALWSKVKKMTKGRRKKRAKKKDKKIRRGTDLWAEVKKVLALNKTLGRRRKGGLGKGQPAEELSPRPAEDLSPQPAEDLSPQPAEDLSPQPAAEDLSPQPAKSLPTRMPHQFFVFHLVEYTRNGSTCKVGKGAVKLNLLSFPTSLDPTGHGEIIEDDHVRKFTFSGGEGDKPFDCQCLDGSKFVLVPDMLFDSPLMRLTMIFPRISGGGISSPRTAVFQMQSELGELPQSSAAQQGGCSTEDAPSPPSPEDAPSALGPEDAPSSLDSLSPALGNFGLLEYMMSYDE